MMTTPSIRQDLVKRRREVLARYRDALVRADEELAQLDIEDATRATEQWDARVLSELSHVDLRELARLTAAIHKIDDGTYGRCDDCGNEISADRLHALPTTSVCFDCASEHEHAQRVHA